MLIDKWQRPLSDYELKLKKEHEDARTFLEWIVWFQYLFVWNKPAYFKTLDLNRGMS